MLRELSARHRSWPLAAPFRISRGVKHSAETVVVEIRQDGCRGRGESVPYARYGETVESVLHQIECARLAIAGGVTRTQLAELLPAGAARNALDCALWDLQAQLAGSSVWSLLQVAPPQVLTTALTVSLDTPERMGEAAARIASARLVKVKVDASAPAAQIQAVRRAAPDARLIVDPNESWDIGLLREMQPVLAALDVALVEQPLPATDDDALQGFESVAPICADESCHVAADLPRLRGRYQAVNIKLDKTGGLTEALALRAAAHADGFRIMVGCMICSSLAVAPAFLVARDAEFVDLDGPLWLKADHDGGVRSHNGALQPAAAGFWGQADGTIREDAAASAR
jgi:L-alanine-DL-glutamate epimerase-like enolase superfamily enzyme